MTRLKFVFITLAAFMTVNLVAQDRLPVIVSPPRPTLPTLTATQCECSVEVAVTRHDSYEPISDAKLTLSITTPVADGFGTRYVVVKVADGLTDSAGRFLFRDLVDGMYGVTVERDGYFESGAGSILVGRPTPQIPGNNGLKQKHQIPITMTPGGMISGRVRDADGQPVNGVSIQGFRLTYQNGIRKMEFFGPTEKTDDLGEFQLRWLAAGEYFIRAESGSNPLYATYHPDTLDSDRAVPVVLREGEYRSDIDITLPKPSSVSISGKVIVSFEGGDFDSAGKIVRSVAAFYLIRRSANVFDNPHEIPNVDHSDSMDPAITEFPFVIHDVPPGEYDFYPIFTDVTRGHVDNIGGHAVIHVGSENIQDVVVTVRRSADLAGHVTLPSTNAIGRTTTLNPTNLIPSVGIVFLGTLPYPLVGSRKQSASIDKNGQFNFRGLIEGRYAITTTIDSTDFYPTAINSRAFYTVVNSVDFYTTGVNSADFYVSDISQGSRSIYDDGVVQVGSDSSDPIEVTVSSGSATVQGTIQNTQKLRGTLVLVPDPPRRQNFGLYQRANISPGDNFAFTFKGIPPGTYKLFAFEYLLYDAEKIPEIISRFESQGVRVTVGPGSSVADVKVPLIPNNN